MTDVSRREPLIREGSLRGPQQHSQSHITVLKIAPLPPRVGSQLHHARQRTVVKVDDNRIIWCDPARIDRHHDRRANHLIQFRQARRRNHNTR